MKELLSITEISRATGLEESLLRFYESEYSHRLPDKILHGDSLVYSADAVQAFKQIHALHAPDKKNVPESANRYARVIAVTSGKGGVGKTNIALNLAIEFQRQGSMSLILDADMGMANIHLLAGLNPGRGLADVINSGVDIADIIAPGPEGIGIIPGGGGILSLSDSTRGERMEIMRSLERVERQADIILVDTGAGMGPSVRDFLMCADEILFVLVPEITSLADAYGLLKSLHREKMRQCKLYSVINMVQTLKQAVDIATRFSLCADEFLGRKVENVGYIMRDSAIGAATARRTPFSVFKPQARASRNIHNIAKVLLANEMPELLASSAFRRYMRAVSGEILEKKMEVNGIGSEVTSGAASKDVTAANIGRIKTGA
ncbi:MAG: AAA family ATPase [Proteobacteria bacterium]|nr:AAA family ATPase [Pseudomonadota bacterium]MBU1710593.1 AAA family ATPase [Pseudomonadota bacterium]